MVGASLRFDGGGRNGAELGRWGWAVLRMRRRRGVPRLPGGCVGGPKGVGVATPGQSRVHGHRIVSLRGVLEQLDEDVRAGRANGLRGIPTGFSPLDSYLHGGLRVGELFLLGGGQGVGKSTWALQLARFVAAGGHGRALYVCFEHSEEFLLERLIAMEARSPVRTSRSASAISGPCWRTAAGLVSMGAGSGTCWARSGRRSRCCGGWPSTRTGCSWSRRGP